MPTHIITHYTVRPLHVGSGDTTDREENAVARERITGWPHIPSSGLKGAWRARAREHFASEEQTVRALFGEDRPLTAGEGQASAVTAYAGAVSFSHAQLLALPVRSARAAFCWITCPAALTRLHRSTGISVPKVTIADGAVIGPAAIQATAPGAAPPDPVQKPLILLEEYAFEADNTASEVLKQVVTAILPLSSDSLWQDSLPQRLVLVPDDVFSHFAEFGLEYSQHVKIDHATRTAEDKKLFRQEDVPAESLFYSVVDVSNAGRSTVGVTGLDTKFNDLIKNTANLQLGADLTTGLGFTTVTRYPWARKPSDEPQTKPTQH